MSVPVTFIRHGKTAGNLRGAYIGKTDEPLCPEGKDALRERLADGFYPPEPGLLLVSPLARCRETAAILYPGAEPRPVADFRETDFGEFEGKSYADLNGNPDYQRWIDSGGQTAFPGGEEPAAFRVRCATAFRAETAGLSDGSKLTIVCHGGTIMAILGAFSSPRRDFYSWQAQNGGGFRGMLDPKTGQIFEITPLTGRKDG